MSKDPGYSDSRKDSQGSRMRELESKLSTFRTALEKIESLGNSRSGRTQESSIAFEALCKVDGGIKIKEQT